MAADDRPPRCIIGTGEQVAEATLTFDDNDHLRELVGEFGAHLKMVSRALGVDVTQRGNTLHIASTDGSVDLAKRLLRQLYGLVEQGQALHATDVHHGIRILQADSNADLRHFFRDVVLMGPSNRAISPRTPGQRAYLHALRRAPVVFGVGPAGTGKTYLAMAQAVSRLLKGEVRRIILTRPAVEAGEKLGFLPGDLVEKVNPYLRPLYDALHDMLSAERVARLMEKQVIEVAPLAFMRGRTLNEAYVILDEAQNTTVEQMKMFLTRLGDDARMVITGDVTQVDLPRGSRSGLMHAIGLLDDVEGIDIVRLSSADVVRHPLVASIIDAYERAESARHKGEGAA